MKLIVTLPRGGLRGSRLPTLGATLQQALGLSSVPEWQIVIDEAQQPLTTREAADRCGLSPDGFRRAAKAVGVEPLATVAQAQTWRASDVERVRVERRPKGWPKKGKE